MTEKVLLPGTEKQSQILIGSVNEEIKKILVTGSGSVNPGLKLRDHYKAEVIIIVEDEDSLLSDRMLLKGEQNISVRMMDFTNTDFRKDWFDLIYAQGSVSDKRRSKIIKEFSRILVNNGILCVGEISSTSPDPPKFVRDIWENSDISPLKDSELVPFYISRNFQLVMDQDLQTALTEYYSLHSEMLESIEGDLLPNEKSYYKKIINRISHESNVYLKLGGDKYMGFRMLILRKSVI